MDVKQTPLDRVIRVAQDRPVTLPSHASPDIDLWLAGEHLPPSPGKRAVESGQFRTLGGHGVPHFTHQSAFGLRGKHGGLAVYSDPIDRLVVPGAEITPLGKKSCRGGLELERVLLLGGELQPLKRATGLGEQGLYLAEGLNPPTYGARVGANLEAVGQRPRGSGPDLRVADPAEVAQFRYGKALNDLTPNERHYLDLARQPDESLTRAAGQGDTVADEVLQGRQELARLKRAADEGRVPRVDGDLRAGGLVVRDEGRRGDAADAAGAPLRTPSTPETKPAAARIPTGSPEPPDRNASHPPAGHRTRRF